MQNKRLYRSSTDRTIGGVCAGLGEFFELDPTIIRLAFIALFFAGISPVAYVILWLVIPNEPQGSVVYKRPSNAPAEAAAPADVEIVIDEADMPSPDGEDEA